MIEEIEYKDFSWQTHSKNWQLKKPNVCQLELTFNCPLHCQHCYSDCYNNPSSIKKELGTRQIKDIIDQAKMMGVVWLCFTGGDPLARADFLNIYSYAKSQGFLITIFTSGYSLTEKIVNYLVQSPPFVIEITINGVTQGTYEQITQVAGSYKRVMAALDMILDRNLALKVKTMATQQNFQELPQIKEFLENKGLKFRPASLLHPRLNGELTPCTLRLRPEQLREVDRLFSVQSAQDDEEGAQVYNEHKLTKRTNASNRNRLFRCAVGGADGMNVDPYGRMFMCSCIREPAIDLLPATQKDIEEALFNTFPKIANSEFKTDSQCRSCDLIDYCYLCPGKAYLETGDMQAPVTYYCELAKQMAGSQKSYVEK